MKTGFTNVLGLLVILVLVGGAGAEGRPFREGSLESEVVRLAREVPPEEGKTDGMVWQRSAEYLLQADGALVRTSRWIVFLTAATPATWRLWEIPVPAGGEAQVLQAGLYDPTSGRPLAPLRVEGGDEEGIASLRLRIPPGGGSLVMALEYRQLFPRRMNVDDVVWLGLDLPQWEQIVTVRTPKGATLFWKGVEAPEPEMSDAGPQDRYVWHVVNRPAWGGDGLLDIGRPVLAFSLRKGAYEALRPLEALETMPLPDPGGAFAKALRIGNRNRAGERLLALMNDSATLLPGVPWDVVRPGEKIPGEGPWTSWERVLLLQRWMTRLGWKVTLWWLPVQELFDDSPATSRAWLRPVLELSPPGGGTFFWDAGQNVAAGETPATLWGTTLFRNVGLRSEQRSMGSGSVERHRLSVEWTLSMDQEGIARGSLDVTLRGGWVGLFAPQGIPDAVDVTSRLLWPLAMRPSLGSPEISPYDYGFRFSFPVTVPLGIPGSGRVLVRFPGLNLPWLDDLRRAVSPFVLRFPFVFEQRFSLTLPERFQVLDLPKGGERSGRVALKEIVKYREKYHTVTAESRLLVKSSRIGDREAGELEAALGALLRWTEKTLPLMRR